MPFTKAAAQVSTEVVRFIGGGRAATDLWKAVMSCFASCSNGVSIQDMCATPTSTPWCLTSSRRALPNCSTPALLAQYAASPGIAPNAASDDTIRR
jgi:hypothetical protein